MSYMAVIYLLVFPRLLIISAFRFFLPYMALITFVYNSNIIPLYIYI